MGGQPTPEDEAMLAGAEVERGASKPASTHHPRTEPVGPTEKENLDAAITGRD